MKEIDWSNLSFGYMKTDYNVRCYYRNGAWGEIEVCSEETIPIHMAATSLHYGQEAFEGLKAYRCPDGKVRVFRSDENAARLQSTCRGILMPEISTERFNEILSPSVALDPSPLSPLALSLSLSPVWSCLCPNPLGCFFISSLLPLVSLSLLPRESSAVSCCYALRLWLRLWYDRHLDSDRDRDKQRDRQMHTGRSQHMARGMHAGASQGQATQ